MRFKAIKQKKRNKFNNIKVTNGVITFDSKREYERWKILDLLSKHKKIRQLEHHTKFPIVYNSIKICTYEADFTYYDGKGNYVVEDVKGVKTAIYRLKKKLVKAMYNIEIKEIK